MKALALMTVRPGAGEHAAARMVEFAQRSGAEHVYRALHVVHERIAACGFIKAQGESMTAVGRNFYGNGDGSETAAGELGIIVHPGIVDASLEIHGSDCGTHR